jgi:hypothetical protein
MHELVTAVGVIRISLAHETMTIGGVTGRYEHY